MATATLTRTDEQVQTDVLAELKWNAQVQPNEIGVAVKDRVVTLTGWVDSYLKKWSAEEAAHRVNGVKAVANDIEVRLPIPPSTRTQTSPWLRFVRWSGMRECRPTRSKPTVSKGWVTLRGEVEWQYQKLDASRSFAASWVSRESPILYRQTVPDSFGPQEKIEHALVRSASSKRRTSPLKCRPAKPF